MICKLTETRTHKVQNETINGINIMAHLVASAANTTIGDTDYGQGDFDPSAVNISIYLKRNNQTHTVCNTNLGLLAAYNTVLKNGFLWRKGITDNQPTGVVKHTVDRSVFIYFGGHINVASDDELLVTVNMTKATFGDAVDLGNSFIQVEANQSVGVEMGIPRFFTYAIQASQGEDVVNLGDNILRVAMLSFERDASKTIFSSASLSSDRLDWTKNEQELVLQHYDNFPYNSADLLLNDLALNKNPLYYPHTRLIHDRDEIDRAKLKWTMVGANINASKNFVCYTDYVTSREILDKAIWMKNKHNKKDNDKVPVSTPTN